ELVVLQEALPPLFEKAKGVVPALLEHTSYEYLNARNKGIQLDQYEISQNLDVISSLLQEDLGRLRNGETHQIIDHMLESEKRLAQINESIQKETRFYDEVQNRYPELEEQLLNLGISLDKLKALYARVSERFGFENWETRLASMDEQFTRMVVERAELKTMVDAGHVAYSVIHVTFKQLDNSMQVMYNDLTQMSEKLESACSDESRGQKQLVKLQVILNDIKISIHKHHLPSISAKYQEDLQYANLYVKDVVDALDMVPMDVADLNEKVKVAIDYVYKLYNNVNNLVGVASLVEETICLGNRYRTTMPDVDSALTRAELCFRNGEYTKALKIAVSTIEKIHPGAYEKILAKAPANA
ncbi:MAG: septation ring formation regulator EzrA, partial [Erysipelotrichaceae bacterium]